MIMIKNENMVYWGTICHYTDFLSVTSFYTAPISFIDFPSILILLAVALHSHMRKKPSIQRRPLLELLGGLEHRQQAADIHLHDGDLSRGVGGQQRGADSFCFAHVPARQAQVKRIIFFQQSSAEG